MKSEQEPEFWSTSSPLSLTCNMALGKSHNLPSCRFSSAKPKVIIVIFLIMLWELTSQIPSLAVDVVELKMQPRSGLLPSPPPVIVQL